MKLKANKKIIGLSLSLVVAAVFLLINPVHAGNWGLDLLSGICSAIVGALGWVLIKIMSILVYFAQYNGFITSAAVVNGWVIVRDVCNMFFVLILLIIAFATILQIEEYNYKKWLPKLILMAVLINFSKTICGLLIDAAQIVMLTFVNSFKDIVGANLTSALGIADWTKIKDTGVGDWEVAGVLIMAVIYMVIAIVVVSAMLAMIAMRIVMIWIYVVLSPIAYLTAAFPAGKSYSSRWWKEFTQNLIVGPVLAFFIWLSFTSLASFSSTEFMNNANQKVDTGATNTASSTPMGTSNTMIKFVIAIGMLLGGMRIAQEIGGDAAQAAGSVFAKGNNLAMSPVRWAGKAAKDSAKWAGGWIGTQAGDLRDMASEKLGVDLNIVAAEKRRREQVAHNRALRQARVRDATLTTAEQGKTWLGRKAALFSTGDVGWQNLMDGKFFKGSPGVVKNNLEKIEEEKKKKDAAEKIIIEIDNKTGNVVTAAEDRDNQVKIKDLDKKNYKLGEDRKAITESGDYKKLIGKEKAGALTDDETKDLAKKKADIEKIDNTVNKNTEEKETLKNKNIVVADQTAKAAKLAEYKNERTNSSNAIAEADKEITKFTDVLRKNKLSEVQSARAEIDAKLESEASKKIANFSNPDQLVAIFKEAEEQQDKGLMAACYKKLAKTGNYNELNKALGFGTGYDGMIGMSKQLQDKGGMTEQDARALVAEIGELAKSVNHFEAYGTMSMNKAGQWEESGKDNQEAAILAEKSKVQVQQFVRAANRLGNGSYQNGQPHDAEHWDISRSTVALFASKDKAYSEDLSKTGNINLIQFLGANPKNLIALERAGAKLTAGVIKEVCEKAKKNAGSPDVSNPLKTIQNTIV